MKKVFYALTIALLLVTGCGMFCDGDDPVTPDPVNPGTLMDGPALCAYLTSWYVDETVGWDHPSACSLWELRYEEIVQQFLIDENRVFYYVQELEAGGIDVPDYDPYGGESPCGKNFADQNAEEASDANGE